MGVRVIGFALAAVAALFELGWALRVAARRGAYE
tara:strand:- start:391 stop:492 length:102 start_codon:yes stop_codon:yes gene_type:complete